MATYTEPIVDLDVINTYNKLMKASTAQGSVYLHAKETVTELVQDSDMTAAEKAAVISQTIGGIATQMTSNALNAAIQITKENRDAPYELAKLRAETELVQAQTKKMGYDSEASKINIDKVKADLDATKIGGWRVQAEIYSKNGIDVSTQNIGDAMLHIPALVKNRNSADVISAEQARAGIYKTLANSARVDGNVTVSTDASGKVLGLTPLGNMRDTLTGAQTKVAVRQEQGFDDNKLQHAANSSATMIGTLLSTENLDIIEKSGTDDVALWRNAVTKLSTSDDGDLHVIETITITVFPDTATTTELITVSGTSENLVSGTNLEAYIFNPNDGVNVNLGESSKVTTLVDNGVWEVVIDATGIKAGNAKIAVGAGSVFGTIQDAVDLAVT